MNAARRIGAEDSTSRSALLDAAGALMLQEGYAAVTSRRVAAEAGLKPQLVHYYFRTMDDLFIALLRRGAEQNLERQARALASPDPVRALWELNLEPAGTAMAVEFSALSNHRKAVRAEVAAYAETFRRLQAEALASVLEARGIPGTDLAPEALAVVMVGLSRMLVMEDSLGVSGGHGEALELVDRLIEGLNGDRPG